MNSQPTNISKKQGFTLVEMIVSLGVFSVVVTIAVGALLVLISSNEQLQKEQSVMTNLSFAIDSMTREIRTGRNYFCDARPNKNAGANGEKIFQDGEVLNATSTQNCIDGNPSDRDYHGLSFVEGGRSVTGAVPAGGVTSPVKAAGAVAGSAAGAETPATGGWTPAAGG